MSAIGGISKRSHENILGTVNSLTECIYDELLCVFVDFYVSGTQDAEATKSLVEVVGRGGCTHPSLDRGQGFQY